ncbi:MAG: hypothetical protein J6K39_02170 [Clostridia bacterium]|nr:hypothetical protein [Clostridia bacterium]
MSKSLKITTIVISCLFAVLSIVIIFWHFGEDFSKFYSQSTKEFAIPGLSTGFTPQGLCEEDDKFYVSGYMSNGSASRIYVVDEAAHENDKHFTLTYKGQDYVEHAGGIATDGQFMWIVGDKHVNKIEFSDVESVENGGKIEIVERVESANGADFVTIENGNLWIGEFHKDGKYDTDEPHHIQTSDGKTNKAVSFCYDLATVNANGFTAATPIKALSTGSLVQGMLVEGNKIVTSASYSLAKSILCTCENILTEDAAQEFDFNGTNIPLYVLEDKYIEKTILAPCMSEEIEFANGKVYVLFESACIKYGLITRESLRNVYSFKI